MTRLQVLSILFVAAVAAAQPAAATAPVTVTPNSPVDPNVIAQDKANIKADKLILKAQPKGSTERKDARVVLASAKLQLALDQQAQGIPGPVEGVGLPFVLAGAAGGALVWGRRRKRAGAADDSTPSR
jgi:hypothetical protein